jgi:rfaE bifunctional protein nucleotidyltransferase chain/domain
VAPEIEERLIDRLDGLWDRCDAAIVSDYGYGVLTLGVIARLAELQAEAPRVLVVDSKQSALYRDAGPTAIKPNYGEALRLLGASGPAAPTERIDWMTTRGPEILETAGARIVSVTLDAEGALVFERDRPPYRTFAKAERPSRAAGAGDTFAAALALALAAGAETPAAADLASAAAVVVVAKDGTASCTSAELREKVSPAGKSLSGSAELVDCAVSHRRQGRRVVFTNGCFDILHRGHVSYLSRAKALGDVLIVGVNSGAGIGRFKGPSRPINPLEDRLQVLSALSCVDHVVPFDEDTPHELIRVVRPDVFVKGGDYTRATLPRRPWWSSSAAGSRSSRSWPTAPRPTSSRESGGLTATQTARPRASDRSSARPPTVGRITPLSQSERTVPDTIPIAAWRGPATCSASGSTPCLVSAVGCRTADKRMTLRVPDRARRRMDAWLGLRGLNSGCSWAMIHPGSTAPSRRYPPESFAAVARRLVHDHGLRVVFTGGPSERDTVEAIRLGMGDAPSLSLAGELNLSELAALIARAPLLVSNNTGPIHVAAALGTPVVDLYALTNPPHTPWGVPNRVLNHDVPCKYCYRSVCPERHHDCLRLVTPGQVVAAVVELLGMETASGRVTPTSGAVGEPVHAETTGALA